MRYVIWDKTSQIITPVGEILSAQEWKDRYPMSKLPNIDLVIAGDSAINGAFCNEYTSMVENYRRQGCDFTGCESQRDYLDAIEEFEDKQNEPIETVDYQEEIMYALQDIAVNTMPMEEL